MNVALRTDYEGNRARLTPTGPFDLAHAMVVAKEIENAEERFSGCVSVDVDLAQLDRIDGAGAVMLARLLDRLNADGRHARVIEGPNPEMARLIARYRERREGVPTRQASMMRPLMRIGKRAAQLPGKASEALDFTGRCAASLPKVAQTPSSIDWPHCQS